MTAAAVHATASGLLLAAADDSGVSLLVALPAGTAPGTAVADYLADAAPGVVVLVGGTAPGPAPFPGDPRVLPVPVAAAVLATGPAVPPGPALVLDAGPGRADAWLVDGTAVTRLPPVAGPPDPASRWATSAHRIAGAARAARARSVVLAGERGAETDLLRAVAGAAGCPVRPAGPLADDDPAAVDGAGPATAAVLGAALLGAALAAEDPPDAAPPGAAPPGAAPPGAAPPGADLPGSGVPAPRRAPRLRRWSLPAAASLGVVLVAAGLLVGRAGTEPVGGPPAVVQYGYAAALPGGWEHTGGDPARMRTLLTPVGRPDGVELIVLERSPLGYDARREPGRAARELAVLLAGVPDVTGPEPRSVAGRAVLGYTQRDGATVTDWHVVLDGTDELLAGCRRPAAEPGPGPACAAVVGSLRRVP